MRAASLLSRTLLGALVALGGLELGLRAVATTQLPPFPAVARDSAGGRPVVSRQIAEGIGRASFSRAGARLTGNPPISGAPTVVVLGDSYVVAREVGDAATMGAWVERLARDSGRPLNVRQYGWRGAGPPTYLAAAGSIMERWKPAAVVVVLSQDDLDSHPLGITQPSMRIAPDGGVRLVGELPLDSGRPRDGLTSSWVTAMLIQHRWTLVRLRLNHITDRWRRRMGISATAPVTVAEAPVTQGAVAPAPPPDAAEIAAVPSAVVRELARAYGERLRLIYVADVRINGGETADPLERALLESCATFRVDCISTRDEMRAWRARGAIVRGFSTTTLGEGHLNEAGHELVGRVIWGGLRER